jgi:hypothetical protein
MTQCFFTKFFVDFLFPIDKMFAVYITSTNTTPPKSPETVSKATPTPLPIVHLPARFKEDHPSLSDSDDDDDSHFAALHRLAKALAKADKPSSTNSAGGESTT